jgi:hypothetical protein
MARMAERAILFDAGVTPTGVVENMRRLEHCTGWKATELEAKAENAALRRRLVCRCFWPKGCLRSA